MRDISGIFPGSWLVVEMATIHRIAVTDIYLLAAEEVRYEVYMRTGQSVDLLDANQAREHLRTVLTLDKDRLDETAVSGQFVISDINKEIYVIEQKLAKQKQVVESFSGKRHSRTYHKCYAKLNHAWNRTSALPINDDTQATRLELHKEIMDLLWSLETKASVSESEAEPSSEDEFHATSGDAESRRIILGGQVRTGSQLLDASDPHEVNATSSQNVPSAPPAPLSSSSPNNYHNRSRVSIPTHTDTRCNETGTTVRRVSIPDQPARQRYYYDQNPTQLYCSRPSPEAQPNLLRPVYQNVSHNVTDLKLYKWKLKYSGDNPKESLSEFLTNILDRCQSRAITPDRLLGNCADLFEGSAKAWYHAFGTRIRVWDEFVRQLRTTFLDSDYDYRLKEEIRQRRQGKDENISIFIAKMINLFSLLSVPMSPVEQLDVVEHNILPNYQRSLAFSNHTSVEELLQFLLRLEVGEARASRMQDSSSVQSLLEPQMQYRTALSGSYSQQPNNPHNNTFSRRPNTQPGRNAPHFSRHVSAIPAPVVSRRELQNSSLAYCWNCGGPHKFRQCDQPWSLFCHGCGLHGARRRTCPNCSGNGRQPGAAAEPSGENLISSRSNAAVNPDRNS